MIQALSPHTSQKAFTDGIGARGVKRRFEQLDATRCCNSSETGVSLSQLLRGPSVRRRACHTNVDHSARLEFDDEEGKERAKKQIGHLQEIAGPHVFCVIAQQRRPVLSSRSPDANMSHRFLNGPLTHANIQLEQFPTDAFGSPKSVLLCHLLDQGDGLSSHFRLMRVDLGSALPIQAKALTRPSQKCFWLNDQERLFPCSNYPCQEYEEQPIRLRACWSFHLPLENDDLLA